MLRNLLENLEQLVLVNLFISVFVDLGDQSLDFGLGGQPVGLHVFQGCVNQIEDFAAIEGSAVVLVELLEHCFSCWSEYDIEKIFKYCWD